MTLRQAARALLDCLCPGVVLTIGGRPIDHSELNESRKNLEKALAADPAQGRPGRSEMLQLSKRIEDGLNADTDADSRFAPPLGRSDWWMIASSLGYAARFDEPVAWQFRSMGALHWGDWVDFGKWEYEKVASGLKSGWRKPDEIEIRELFDRPTPSIPTIVREALEGFMDSAPENEQLARAGVDYTEPDWCPHCSRRSEHHQDEHDSDCPWVKGRAALAALSKPLLATVVKD